MDLQFKEACERCDGALSWIDEAWVCSSECTYCADCRDEVAGVCPNCSEMLRRRERRTKPVGRQGFVDDDAHAELVGLRLAARRDAVVPPRARPVPGAGARPPGLRTL